MRITLRMVVVWSGLVSSFSASALAAGDSFTPGHFYTPYQDGTVFEWDMNLNPVGSFRIGEEINGATGVTFGANGNLVMVAARPDGVHVIEVNARGQILHDYDTDHGSMLQGSYIDYDPVSQRYAFANEDRITILDSELSLVASTTGFEFDRASGVAWRADGGLYATDQLQDGLLLFGPNLAYTPSSFIGADAGIDLAGDFLYMINSNNGEIRRYDTLLHQATTIVTVPGSSPLDICVLPDGNLLTTTNSGFLRLFSQSGVLLDSAPPAAFAGGSGLAYFVPGPGGASVFVLALCRTSRRRRVP